MDGLLVKTGKDVIDLRNVVYSQVVNEDLLLFVSRVDDQGWSVKFVSAPCSIDHEDEFGSSFVSRRETLKAIDCL